MGKPDTAYPVTSTLRWMVIIHRLCHLGVLLALMEIGLPPRPTSIESIMTYKTHARIDGPLVMIGFGSIGRGTLPLILRHIDFDR